MQDRALNAQDRLSSTATLTVKVSDVEDQPPAFQYVGCPLNDRGVCITPNYTTTVIDRIHRLYRHAPLNICLVFFSYYFFVHEDHQWRHVRFVDAEAGSNFGSRHGPFKPGTDPLHFRPGISAQFPRVLRNQSQFRLGKADYAGQSLSGQQIRFDRQGER